MKNNNNPVIAIYVSEDCDEIYYREHTTNYGYTRLAGIKPHAFALNKFARQPVIAQNYRDALVKFEFLDGTTRYFVPADWDLVKILDFLSVQKNKNEIKNAKYFENIDNFAKIAK